LNISTSGLRLLQHLWSFSNSSLLDARSYAPGARAISNCSTCAGNYWWRRHGYCRAYTPGTHARKEEDRLLVEFPCNPTRTPTL
jgi:hypothetical protein